LKTGSGVSSDTGSDAAVRTDAGTDGFAIVRQALSAEALAVALQESVDICRGIRGQVKGLPDDRCELDDDELLGRCLAIHFPHKISSFYHQLLFNPAIIEALNGVIGPDVKCMQSMLFVKSAGKPGQAWHQDEHFIPTRDRSLWGAWVALDEATIDNGCLWVLPGSHRSGVIWPTKPHGTDDFDGGEEAYGFPDDVRTALPIELQPGDAVIFHGYLLHRSLPNRRTSGFRRAIVNHYMSAQSLLPWDWDGRLTLKNDVRDIVMISGQDPYGYRGTESLTYPYVRFETGLEAPSD